MTIYMYAGDGFVEFCVYSCDKKNGEEMFTRRYGQRPRCLRENAFLIMEDIDGWYSMNFNDGCVRFEFG